MPALDIRSQASLLLPGKCLLLSEHELYIMHRLSLNSFHVKKLHQIYEVNFFFEDFNPTDYFSTGG